MNEKLTEDEKQFLQNYRRLSEHDKGYVDAMLEALEKTKRRKGWKVCNDDPQDK